MLTININYRYFYIYPSTKYADLCEFYLCKLHANFDDFVIKLKVSIQQSDDTLKRIAIFERKAEEFKTGFGLGWPYFIIIDDLFKVENKYLANDCLTFVIDVSICNLLAKIYNIAFVKYFTNYFFFK